MGCGGGGGVVRFAKHTCFSERARQRRTISPSSARLSSTVMEAFVYFASRVWPCLFTRRTKLIPIAARSRTAGHQVSILTLRRPCDIPVARFAKRTSSRYTTLELLLDTLSLHPFTSCIQQLTSKHVQLVAPSITACALVLELECPTASACRWDTRRPGRHRM